MKRYWLAIDRAFAELTCESGSFFALHLIYTPSFLSTLGGLLRRAAAAAEGNEAYAQRVALAAHGFQNAVAYTKLRDAMNRGDFGEAKRVYDHLYSRNEAEVKRGYGNHYTVNYLARFIGKHVTAGAEATAPPNRLLQVLPDRMRLAYDAANTGTAQRYHQPAFDDSNWPVVATYSNTLNAQGFPDRKTLMWYRTSFNVPQQHGPLSLFFVEVDGYAVTVYVNAKEVAALTAKEARRKPFSVTITNAVKPGKNVLAVRVDHTRITELFLGGIIRPVLLIEAGT
jgi:hypothetical protein